MPPRARARKDASLAPTGSDVGEGSSTGQLRGSTEATESTAPNSPAPSESVAGSSARRPRRSAARQDYAQIEADGIHSDEDGEDEENTAGPSTAKGKSKAARSKIKPKQSRKRRAEQSDDDFQASDNGENAEDDDDAASEHASEVNEPNDDDAEDDASPRPRRARKKARTTTASSPRATSSRSSKGKKKEAKPPQRNKGRPASGKALAGHEQRPLYLADEQHGPVLGIRNILHLADIGVKKPDLVELKTHQKLALRLKRTRRQWTDKRHYIQIPLKNARDLLADWSWTPGKNTSKEKELMMREGVKNHWSSDRASHEQDLDAQADALTGIGGVVLIPEDRQQMTILDARAAAQFRPPLATILPPPDPASLKSVKDFQERSPQPSSRDGDFKIFMGVPETVTPETGSSASPSPGKQAEVEIKARQAKSLVDSCNLSLGPDGYLLNAGASVSSMSWAPASPHDPSPAPEYLALGVSTATPPGTIPRIKLGESSSRKGVIQVWSIGGAARLDERDEPIDEGCRLEYVLCIPQGEVTAIKFAPTGWDLRSDEEDDDETGEEEGSYYSRRIGLLAVALSDHRVVVYSMPRPEDVRRREERAGGAKGKGVQQLDVPHITVHRILTLPLSSSRQATCLDWGGTERLLAGCSDGSFVCWDTGSLFRAMTSDDQSRVSILEHPLPSHSFKVHDSAILSLAFFQLPPRHSEGLAFQEKLSAEEQGFVHDGLPHLVMSCGLDLGARFSDLDDGGVSVGSQKSRREPGYAAAYIPFLSSFIAESSGLPRLISFKPNIFASSRSIGSNLFARQLSLATSSFHPLVAGGHADGSVKLFNTVANLVKPNTQVESTMREKKNWGVYRLELNRFTGQIRYVDNLLPDDFGMTGNKGKDTGERGLTGRDTIDRFAWHPSIGIRSVEWCPNVSGPLLLASASAVGLVRIDKIAGKEGEEEEEEEDEEEGEEEEDELAGNGEEEEEDE